MGPRFKINRDLMRMVKQANQIGGTEAAELVFRAYTAGIRDGASELLEMAGDLGREFEKIDLSTWEGPPKGPYTPVQCPKCGANQTNDRGQCHWCKHKYR